MGKYLDIPEVVFNNSVDYAEPVHETDSRHVKLEEGSPSGIWIKMRDPFVETVLVGQRAIHSYRLGKLRRKSRRYGRR